MLSSPCIPRRDSLLENSEVLLICHRVSLLFECCSHYMALEGTLQGRIAWEPRLGRGIPDGRPGHQRSADAGCLRASCWILRTGYPGKLAATSSTLLT